MTENGWAGLYIDIKFENLASRWEMFGGNIRKSSDLQAENYKEF